MMKQRRKNDHETVLPEPHEHDGKPYLPYISQLTIYLPTKNQKKKKRKEKEKKKLGFSFFRPRKGREKEKKKRTEKRREKERQKKQRKKKKQELRGVWARVRAASISETLSWFWFNPFKGPTSVPV